MGGNSECKKVLIEISKDRIILMHIVFFYTAASTSMPRSNRVGFSVIATRPLENQVSFTDHGVLTVYKAWLT